jgi:hypothetical protein
MHVIIDVQYWFSSIPEQGNSRNSGPLKYAPLINKDCDVEIPNVKRELICEPRNSTKLLSNGILLGVRQMEM